MLKEFICHFLLMIISSLITNPAWFRLEGELLAVNEKHIRLLNASLSLGILGVLATSRAIFCLAYAYKYLRKHDYKAISTYTKSSLLRMANIDCFIILAGFVVWFPIS